MRRKCPSVYSMYIAPTIVVFVSFKNRDRYKLDCTRYRRNATNTRQLDIQLNLIINPLNIKIFTIYKIISTEYITYV